MSKILATSALVAALSLGYSSFAQDAQYSILSAAPMAVNPAYTGNFNGVARADVTYSSHWASVTTPFVKSIVSVDLPVYTFKNGNFFAAGAYLNKQNFGDDNADYNNYVLSAAYHMHLSLGADSSAFHNCEVVAGLQVGYELTPISYELFYFVAPTSQVGLGQDVLFYPVNAGLSFAQSVSANFNYTVGIAGYNLNRSTDAFQLQEDKIFGVNRQFVVSAGANWSVTKRLMLRPAVIYNTGSSAIEFTAGNEFHYVVNDIDHAKHTTTLFVGVWHSGREGSSITGGAEFANFRIGAGYTYNDELFGASNTGKGAVQLMLRYIAPANKKTGTKRNIPSVRF